MQQNPNHVAVILDGNGRWASIRKLPRIQGHVEGAKRAKELVTFCAESGIAVLTLYAFSTENWKRPAEEVSFLMELLARYIRQEGKSILQNNIRLRVLGELSRIPSPIGNELLNLVEQSKTNSGLQLNFAISYGGREEITTAVREIAKACMEKKLAVSAINEVIFSKFLYTAELPDPDLIIRTSGEQRISNFLLWQGAYSEFYSVETLWPDFTLEHFNTALEDYKKRKRRFGQIESQTI